MCLCASPLVAALVLACGARDAADDAATDAAADAALCAPEVDSVVVDLNVHPDGAGFRFAGDTTTCDARYIGLLAPSAGEAVECMA